MKIELRLFATLRENRQKVMMLELPEGASVAELVDSFGIPQSEIAILMINGRHSKLKDILHDGDIVSLFPPVGGG